MSFDFGSATETQQEYLHRLAHNYTTPTDSDEWYFSDFLYPRPILWFFLTLDGERDVCEIGSITFKESELDVSNRPTELLDSLPISYQKEVSVISYEDSDQNLPWWYICGDGQEISELVSENMSEREAGELYGYPDWAIDAFVADECVSVREIFDSNLGFSIDDLKYLKLLPYMLVLEEERIAESVEKGKAWANRLYELSEEYEYLSGLKYRVDEVLAEQREQLEARRLRQKNGWDV